MAISPNEHNRDEWPTKFFKMRGFASVNVHYVPMDDRMVVTLARRLGDEPVTIDLPNGYRTMTLEAFRHWVSAEVEKLSVATDFPTISFSNVVSS